MQYCGGCEGLGLGEAFFCQNSWSGVRSDYWTGRRQLMPSHNGVQATDEFNDKDMYLTYVHTYLLLLIYLLTLLTSLT